MKKHLTKALFAGAILICGTGFAQTSDNATLEVELVSIQTIIVNVGQSTVNLKFDTQADYTNGVSSLQADHLAILSTVNFIVNVKASGDLTHATSADVVPLNTITITAADGSVPPPNSTPAGAITPTTADQQLISADAALIANFDVTYDASGVGYLNKDSGIYSTTVTYTIIPN